MRMSFAIARPACDCRIRRHSVSLTENLPGSFATGWELVSEGNDPLVVALPSSATIKQSVFAC